MTADTPRGLQVFQPTPEVKLEPGKAFAPTEKALKKAYKEAPPHEREALNLEIRRNFYDQKGKDLTADLKDKQQVNGEGASANGSMATDLTTKTIEKIAKEPRKPIYCNSCAIECTRRRYHLGGSLIPPATKIQSIDICPACFFERRYSNVTSATDYVFIEDEKSDSIPDKDEPWTDAELLLLLEALERFDENWTEIADYVGSRTREECVVKFLQLEIEDKYLETEVSGPGYGALDQGRVPFTQSDNPVLSVLGFLAGLSEPSVAAAAAGRSVDEVTKIWRRRIEDGIGGDSVEQENNTSDANAKHESMEIDNVESPQGNHSNHVTNPASDNRDPMRDIANTTFAAAAARASALASNEEREMTRLVSAAVNTTLQKFELKLKQFSEMEAMLQAERRELERGRQQLFLDRLAFRKRVSQTQQALREASLRGGDEGARIAQDVNLGTGERLGFQADGPRVGGDPISNSVSYEI